MLNKNSHCNSIIDRRGLNFSEGQRGKNIEWNQKYSKPLMNTVIKRVSLNLADLNFKIKIQNLIKGRKF